MINIKIITLTALVLLTNCVPVPAQKDEPSAARSAQPEDETLVDTYEAPHQPAGICVPKFVKHLDVEFSLQASCWNQVIMHSGQPQWRCFYNSISDTATAAETNAMLAALIYDRYGYTVSQIQIDEENNSNGHYAQITFVKDYYATNKTQGITGDCASDNGEFDINLDN